MSAWVFVNPTSDLATLLSAQTSSVIWDFLAPSSRKLWQATSVAVHCFARSHYSLLRLVTVIALRGNDPRVMLLYTLALLLSVRAMTRRGSADTAPLELSGHRRSPSALEMDLVGVLSQHLQPTVDINVEIGDSVWSANRVMLRVEEVPSPASESSVMASATTASSVSAGSCTSATPTADSGLVLRLQNLGRAMQASARLGSSFRDAPLEVNNRSGTGTSPLDSFTVGAVSRPASRNAPGGIHVVTTRYIPVSRAAPPDFLDDPVNQEYPASDAPASSSAERLLESLD